MQRRGESGGAGGGDGGADGGHRRARAGCGGKGELGGTGKGEGVEFEEINKPNNAADNFMFDVGSRDELKLSWALKEIAIKKTVPQAKEDIIETDSNGNEVFRSEFHAYSSKPNTGWHCPLPCCGPRWTESEFNHHGTGIVLYFKFLRWLYCTFFFMALFVSPGMYAIVAMGKPDPVLSKGLGALAITTLGNLGEGTRICGSEYEGKIR